MKNAIILAAGKSSRLTPFTYEKPKGLFCVKGEVLIERQIRQLREAGVDEICVVIGYRKEKFFYLEEKYGVKLIINNDFAKSGNVKSLYAAREYLSDTFVCCADHYFVKNPFDDGNVLNRSYRACVYKEGKFREIAADYSDAGVITEVDVGGSDRNAMVGHAYFNSGFSAKLKSFMEKEIDDFGVSGMFWEEFYGKHIKDLTLYAEKYEDCNIWEFDSIEDLCRFDSEFLMNVDSDIISNIVSVLKCRPDEITDIDVINAGLTNASFCFCVKGEKYVYRHPGGNADSLVDRRTELFSQKAATELGIDKSVIYTDISGWKVSHYIENSRHCDVVGSDRELSVACEYLHKIHGVTPDGTVKIFDNIVEGKKLLARATATSGNVFRELEPTLRKLEALDAEIKKDAERLGYERVVCHNDVYDLNFLTDDKGDVYLIDWEYSGLNYAVNDICGITTRYDWTDEEVYRYFKVYAGHDLTADERRFFYGYMPISSFYWLCWGLYKGSVGDDDGFFLLSAYRNINKYLDKALASYGIIGE